MAGAVGTGEWFLLKALGEGLAKLDGNDTSVWERFGEPLKVGCEGGGGENPDRPFCPFSLALDDVGRAGLIQAGEEVGAGAPALRLVFEADEIPPRKSKFKGLD